MSNAQIHNVGGAFGFGASYGNPPIDVTTNTDQADYINGTATTLYTGDIVAIDATGGQVLQPLTATLNLVIGCVGAAQDLNSIPGTYYEAGTLETNTAPWSLSSIWPVTIDGSFQPPENYEWQSISMGFTNGSASITDSSTNAQPVGALIITPYNSSTNATPQIFQVAVVSGSAGSWTYTGTVVGGSGTTFSGTTGSFTVQAGIPPTSLGPGWAAPSLGGWSSTSQFPANAVVPVIVRGFGRINVNGASSTAKGDFLAGTNASYAATRTAAAAATASQIGTFIGIALEAYAARDTTLRTLLGITGHDSIRGIIGKF